MTLLWGILAVCAALLIGAGLYNYFNDSSEIDSDAKRSTGGESPEERAAAIARRQALIEEEKRKERENFYTEQ